MAAEQGAERRVVASWRGIPVEKLTPEQVSEALTWASLEIGRLRDELLAARKTAARHGVLL